MYPDDQGLIDGATPPASDLVIAQFDTLFALLQSAFDPVALACMNAKRAIGVSIGAWWRWARTGNRCR